MKKKLNSKTSWEMGWAFALINKRMGEVHFEKGKGLDGIYGHSYINKDDFWWTKKDKKLMKKDIKKNQFTYRKGKYKLAKSFVPDNL